MLLMDQCAVERGGSVLGPQLYTIFKISIGNYTENDRYWLKHHFALLAQCSALFCFSINIFNVCKKCDYEQPNIFSKKTVLVIKKMLNFMLISN
jgi:hypothetical protein